MEDPDGFHVYMSALYGVNRAFQVEAVRLLQGYLALLGTALAQQPPYRRLEPARLEACALWLFSASESFVLAARALGYNEQRLAAMKSTIARLLLNGPLFALSASTGKTLWEFQGEVNLELDIEGQSMQATQDAFYVTSGLNLFALDPEIGRQLWQFSAGSPARDTQNGYMSIARIINGQVYPVARVL